MENELNPHCRIGKVTLKESGLSIYSFPEATPEGGPKAVLRSAYNDIMGVEELRGFALVAWEGGDLERSYVSYFSPIDTLYLLPTLVEEQVRLRMFQDSMIYIPE